MKGEALPLSEYPRPHLKREPWLSLHGSWEYAIVSGRKSFVSLLPKEKERKGKPAESRDKYRYKIRNKSGIGKQRRASLSLPRLPYEGPWEGRILVPFSPETESSGVERMLLPGDILYYRRIFRLPRGFLQDRLIIHFEGVDQECRLWCNKKEVGSHKGGQ